MADEKEKILAMLEEGTITAAEAEELLAAIDESDAAEPAIPEVSWPDMLDRGQAWRRPFNLSLFGSLIGGSLLLSTREASGFMRFLRIFIFWPFTLFAAAMALITYFTRESPWLHVRVQSEDSPTFSISLPFPAKAINQALRVARSRAPNADVQEKIDAAVELIAQMDTSNLKDPLVIDISDEGDSVQVYLN